MRVETRTVVSREGLCVAWSIKNFESSIPPTRSFCQPSVLNLESLEASPGRNPTLSLSSIWSDSARASKASLRYTSSSRAKPPQTLQATTQRSCVHRETVSHSPPSFYPALNVSIRGPSLALFRNAMHNRPNSIASAVRGI